MSGGRGGAVPPAVVAGADSGLGEAVAPGLARAGADIAVNDVTHPETAEEVAYKIVGFGRRAMMSDPVQHAEPRP